jgi:hypothetical protein
VQPSSQLFKELTKLDIQFKLNWSESWALEQQ